jgi:hypothetical protein
VRRRSVLRNDAAYGQRVRSDPRDPARFPVLPGHQVASVEKVVEEHERYVVVEKLGDAKESPSSRIRDDRESLVVTSDAASEVDEIQAACPCRRRSLDA